MRTKIIKIGNSRGIRIPKPLLEDAGLLDEVSIRVTDEGLVVQSATNPRDDWASAAAQLHERGEDGLIDEPAPTSFDDSEWEWE